MTCPRCQGLLVPETVHDGALSADLLRCVNCGRMAKEGEMPKFIDEAHRERWMEGQRSPERPKRNASRPNSPMHHRAPVWCRRSQQRNRRRLWKQKC